MDDQPKLSATALALLKELIQFHTGLVYENGREYLLVEKLRPLVVDRGFNTFLDYYYYLKHSPETSAEWHRVESALAVNESYFWREIDQILATAQVLVPKFQRLHPDAPVRIWHAGVATGEEAYTLVMALMEEGQYNPGKIEIIATDFNQDALQIAQAGIYRSRSFRSFPPHLYNKYFLPQPNERSQIIDLVRQRVSFRYLNLMDSLQMSQMGRFDIIFCRNVFIYFSQDAIARTVNHFYQALGTPGYLFVAAAESLLKVTSLFELDEVQSAFAYVKLD